MTDESVNYSTWPRSCEIDKKPISFAKSARVIIVYPSIIQSAVNSLFNLWTIARSVVVARKRMEMRNSTDVPDSDMKMT